MSHKNENIRKVYAQSKRVGPFKNENEVRQFSFLIDEPEKLGGTNQAPTPMEYVLGSFNGCILIVIEMIAKEIDFTFTNLYADTYGAIDRRGLFGTANVSPHFIEIKNTVYFETKESKAELEILKEKVKERCPAYNMMNDAGVVITLDWKLNKEEK